MYVSGGGGGGGVISFSYFIGGGSSILGSTEGVGYEIFVYDKRISHPTLGYK